MIIPGGPHVEQLKKGDIIFNAEQTEDLIRTGRTARAGKLALATGTAYNMINAHSSNSTAKGSGPKLKKTTTGSATTGVTTGTDYVTDKNKNKQNKYTWDEFKKWLEKLFDWIEVRIERVSNQIDNLTQQAENVVGYVKKNELVSKAMGLTGTGRETYTLKYAKADEDGVQRVTGISGKNTVKGTQIDNNIRGAQRYFEQANKIYNNAKKTGKVGGIDDIIGKIQSGQININEYNAEQREFIDAYKQW